LAQDLAQAYLKLLSLLGRTSRVLAVPFLCCHGENGIC